MLDMFEQIIVNILNQDLTALSEIDSVIWIYLVIALFIGLECAFLPATPLPCDSLLLLSGSLVSLGVIGYFPLIFCVIFAATLGTNLAYWQGKLIGKTTLFQKWITKIPEKKQQFSYSLINKSTLISLFVVRFIPLIRTLLPMLIGSMKNHNAFSFLTVSFISSIMWSVILVSCGYAISFLPEWLSRLITIALILIPITTLILGVVSFAFVYVKQSVFSEKDSKGY